MPKKYTALCHSLPFMMVLKVSPTVKGGWMYKTTNNTKSSPAIEQKPYSLASTHNE